MARLVIALISAGVLSCATAPEVPPVSLDEAMGTTTEPSTERADLKASSSLAEATRRFVLTLQRQRPRTRSGAPMPATYSAAWGEMFDATDVLLATNAGETSALDIAKTRLVLETNLDADVGAFGDVPSGLAERIPATLRRLSARLTALTWRPHRADLSSFSWPTSPVVVTSAWGDRVHPLHGDVRFHAGVDLWGERAQEVRAAAAGTVVFAGWNGAHGKQVELQHDAHVCTRYSHLQTLLVALGHQVKQGDIIGLVGETGQVTGPHLHFELRRDGESVDPEASLAPPPAEQKRATAL